MLLPNFDYFYFIRHGRTDANELGLMAGGTNDLSINQTGYQQAEAASIVLKEKCSDIKTICSSTMLRARQTSEIILKNNPKNLILSEDLIEWKFGEWEGQSWTDVGHLFLDESSSPEQGEGRSEFKNRIIRGLQLCLKAQGPVLIVAHGGVWFMIQKILNIPIIKTDNCQIFQVSKDTSTFFQTREIRI